MTETRQPGADESQKHWLYTLVPQWAVRRVLVPRGLFGRVSSLMMRRINTEMNEHMVALLDLSGDEHVLEIGFGPGMGVQLLVAALPGGHVAGVDPSPLMVRQAGRRNAAAVGAGVVDLHEGVATDLPFTDVAFDAVCSANSLQLWGDLEVAFAEIARVLVPGGRLALSVHDWAGDDLEGEVVAALADALFADVDVEATVDSSGTTLNVTARRA